MLVSWSVCFCCIEKSIIFHSFPSPKISFRLPVSLPSFVGPPSSVPGKFQRFNSSQFSILTWCTNQCLCISMRFIYTLFIKEYEYVSILQMLINVYQCLWQFMMYISVYKSEITAIPPTYRRLFHESLPIIEALRSVEGLCWSFPFTCITVDQDSIENGIL